MSILEGAARSQTLSTHGLVTKVSCIHALSRHDRYALLVYNVCGAKVVHSTPLTLGYEAPNSCLDAEVEVGLSD